MTFHTKLSYIKSGVRILGYSCLVSHDLGLTYAAIFLIVAEIIGILEELPGMYKGTKTS